MNEQELNRLSRIATVWTQVFQAHRGDGGAVSAAQQALLLRYSGAIFRYLMAAVRDADVADELAQEFALHLLEGKFHAADPGRGRFRDYIKTAVLNLVRRYKRKQGRLPMNLAPEVDCPDQAEDHNRFDIGWRNELLSRTWEALAKSDQERDQQFHLMLSYRTQHPDASSAQMAEELSKMLGRTLTAAGVRQNIHRAREHFAQLLIDEVGRSLQTGDITLIEAELAEQGLMVYCREAIETRRQENALQQV